MIAQPQHAPLTKAALDAVQAALDAAGLSLWRAGTASSPGSPPAYRAERQGSVLRTVVHHDASTLVELALDAEERLSGVKPTAVVAGLNAIVRQ